MARLTPAQNIMMKRIATSPDTVLSPDNGFVWTFGYNSNTLYALSKRSMIEWGKKTIVGKPAQDNSKVRLTPAGREYAIAQGWIAAPVVETPAQDAVSLYDEAFVATSNDEVEIMVGDVVEDEHGYIGIVTEICEMGSYFDVYVDGFDGSARKLTDYSITDVYTAPEAASEPTPARHDDTEVVKDAAIQQLIALRAENATLKAQLAEAVAEDMVRAYIDAETEHFEPYFAQQVNAELDALKTALQTALTHLLRNSPKNAQYVLQQALNK